MDEATRRWLDENPGELPYEVEVEVEGLIASGNDFHLREMVRDMLEMDPDLFGDWDRYQ